jgi:hypothetical protein
MFLIACIMVSSQEFGLAAQDSGAQSIATASSIE